jgi:hypothetical protein
MTGPPYRLRDRAISSASKRDSLAFVLTADRRGRRRRIIFFIFIKEVVRS